MPRRRARKRRAICTLTRHEWQAIKTNAGHRCHYCHKKMARLAMDHVIPPNLWTIATQPYKGSHFATMPPDLAERCIKAGCPRGGHVLDPFGGAGTTGLVADRLGRHATLIELNPAYRDMGENRVRDDAPLFWQAAE